MDIIQVSKTILNYSYTLANIPLFFRSTLLRRKFGSYLKLNREIYDIFPGESCFVLGGGPSLRKIPIHYLVNKKLITVNKLYQWDGFSELNPVAHCAIDPAMYVNETGERLYKEMCSREDTHFLISNNAPDKLLNLRNTYIALLGYLPSSRISPYDLSKPSAAFNNVVLYAIELAIYMGFRDIVLLGCDFNQFASRVESHAYSDSSSTARQCTMTQDLLGHAIAILQHQFLYEFAKSKNVRVLNASEGSLLDVYPKLELTF